MILKRIEVKDCILLTISAAVAFTTPIHGLMAGVGFLIFADLITGIWRAWKKGEKITSSELKRTISKCLLYNLAILSGFVIEYLGVGQFVPVSKIIASTIGVVEFKSMLENFEAITGISVWEELKSKVQISNKKK